MFRNGRSARGEPPEVDARFIARPGNLGVNRSTDRGTTVQLLGVNPDQKAKLVKCFNSEDMPWNIAASVRTEGGTLGSQFTSVLATGYFGNGGSLSYVEFDVRPDTNIGLPGPVIDLDVGWAPWYTVPVAGGVILPAQPANINRPDRATINGFASIGMPSRGSASRTQFATFVGATALAFIDIPPFVDTLSVWVLGGDANYANVTGLSFAAGGTIVGYTGAQLLAFKNSGVKIPVPGNANRVAITTAAATDMMLDYTLSL